MSDLVRGAVALARSTVKGLGLTETVTLRRWRAADAYNAPSYSSALTFDAVVEHSSRRFRLSNGEERVSTHKVTFLEPIPALSPTVSGRQEPIDERDKITFANGQTAQVLLVDGGISDPTTSRGYVVQVWMG